VAITSAGQGIGRVTAERMAARLEYAPHGVSVSAVLPSAVGTALAGVTPEPALNAFRRLMQDDRALRPDSPERADYRSRLDQDTHREENA
jgi:NAD(P)-dependent dehydrogenase (short-subunit alcohol dehydrogenase family)